MTLEGVTWLLHSNRNGASARLQGYLIHDYLKSKGFNSQILLKPPTTTTIPWREGILETVASIVNTRIVVFQKLDNELRAAKLISHLRRRGIVTIFVECDYRPDNHIPEMCDCVVVPSKFLFDFYSSQGLRCVQIPDPIENIISHDAILENHQQRRSTQSIRLVWVGQSSNWSTIEPLRRCLEGYEYRKQFELFTISSHPEADIQWDLQTVAQNVAIGDVGVIPTSTYPGAEAKSANRLLLFMALGVPVIAGDIPAYREIIDDGVNGFIADSCEKWQFALDKLRDPDVRLEIAVNAFNNVVPQFTLDHIAQYWIELFSEITAPVSETPFSKLSQYRRVTRKMQIDAEANLHYVDVALDRHLWGIVWWRFFSALVLLPVVPRTIAGWGYLITRRLYKTKRRILKLMSAR